MKTSSGKLILINLGIIFQSLHNKDTGWQEPGRPNRRGVRTPTPAVLFLRPHGACAKVTSIEKRGKRWRMPTASAGRRRQRDEAAEGKE
jgi:hypothetical protein